MTYKPSDVMVKAAVEQFSKSWGQNIAVETSIRQILRAAFAAAIEAGEAREVRHWVSHAGNECVIVDDARANALILRTQEGEK